MEENNNINNEIKEEKQLSIKLDFSEEFLNTLNQVPPASLESKGVFFIDKEIDKESLKSITEGILGLHFDQDFTDDIYIFINSEGGDLNAGFALIDTISFVKNKVITVALGEIYSMAFFIFIAGDHRIIMPNTISMCHQGTFYEQGSYAEITANKKKLSIQYSNDMECLKRYSKYNTEKEIKKHLFNRLDVYLSAKEMKEHGLCDEIFIPSNDREGKRKWTKQS